MLYLSLFTIGVIEQKEEQLRYAVSVMKLVAQFTASMGKTFMLDLQRGELNHSTSQFGFKYVQRFENHKTRKRDRNRDRDVALRGNRDSAPGFEKT